MPTACWARTLWQRPDDENGRLSRLELANGGTLFLEKIEYLAPELQSALLQVIKQGVLTRLDARRLIRWM
jgi:transcriptional activator for dhaKLM operon